MAIKITIVEADSSRYVQGNVSSTTTTVVNNNRSAVVINRAPTTARRIEVMRGLPGVQNVVVSATEPLHPFENMVWFDIS